MNFNKLRKIDPEPYAWGVAWLLVNAILIIAPVLYGLGIVGESPAADRKSPAHSQTKSAPEEKRSSKWPAVRNKFLDANPTCAACGEDDRKILVVHHVVPFSQSPSLELSESNLIVLCEGPVVNCHLHFGHLRNWHSWNVDVRKDAAKYLGQVKNRPMPKVMK